MLRLSTGAGGRFCPPSWSRRSPGCTLYLFVRVQWRIGDEGDILNGALAVAEGRVPYRDFFDLRGPGSFYWLGLFFKTFGATWQVARLHLLLTGTRRACWCTTSPGEYAALRKLFSRCALVTVVSIPFWPAPHHHWDSNLFALAAVAAFFHWQDHLRPGWLFSSGVLAGLSSCFIYQKGFYLLLSFLAAMAIARLYFGVESRWPSRHALSGGYGAVGLAVVAWFFHIGALPEFRRRHHPVSSQHVCGRESSSVRAPPDVGQALGGLWNHGEPHSRRWSRRRRSS